MILFLITYGVLGELENFAELAENEAAKRIENENIKSWGNAPSVKNKAA